MSSLSITLTATAHSEEEIVAWFIDQLRSRGYAVSEPHAPETVGQFCDRLGICNQTLLRKLASPLCPDVILDRGKSGLKTYALRSNPAFEAFCLNGYAKRKAKAAA